MTMPAGEKGKGNNIAVAVACVTFVGFMVGMSFAAAPLYSLYCQVTGYGGTTQRVEQASDVILDRKIRVTFDANTASDLAWDFVPDQPYVDVRIGETIEVGFTVSNKFNDTSTGEAVFNVTPMQAGAYFNKVQCFCFTAETLKPGEVRDMKVQFFVDPEIVNQAETKGINTITLSYTFYAKQAAEKPVASVKDVGTGQQEL